ncbi:TetR/AcrR family transcriptional regulator [Amycolatopsis anabasis]|uniref:TetR/AcrR family transcriptional regulator n=1 Tax=Amycolatopsis anabasis TaxID=1840409 RepID=UPI00131E8274|nr:TetR/AcrR family transcriptional regulator [Amycolatopsis anabasis]
MANRREESAQESRRRLLDAATELVAEVGPRAASVQAVADRAGISRGSIAWHFGSKEGLIAEVIDHAFATAEHEYRRRLDGSGSLSFAQLVDAHLAVVNAPCGRIFATALPEAMLEDGPLRTAYLRGYERSRALWIEYLERLVADNPGLPEAKHLATMLFSSGIGANVLHHLDGPIDRAGGFASLGRVLELAAEAARG